MLTDGRTDGRTDGQRDVTKLTVPFSNFAKAPKALSPVPKELIDIVTLVPLKNLTYVVPSTTTNGIRLVNTCYMY